jgi:hypothetical protein
MKPQLEALVRQMHDGGIVYSEGVREFKKAFITMFFRNAMVTRAEPRRAWECTATR